ncbi:hypothetical protein CHUAL_011527 [Chamberlinius hualienensis]
METSYIVKKMIRKDNLISRMRVKSKRLSKKCVVKMTKNSLDANDSVTSDHVSSSVSGLQEVDEGFCERLSGLSFCGLNIVTEENNLKHRSSLTKSSFKVKNYPKELTTEELYIVVLYTIINGIGYRNGFNIDVFIEYSRKAFKMNDEDHIKLISMAINKQPPIIVLKLIIIEARDLEAKDPNGLSDPFCVLGIHSSFEITDEYLGKCLDRLDPEEEADSLSMKLLNYRGQTTLNKANQMKSCEDELLKEAHDHWKNHCANLSSKLVSFSSVKFKTLNPYWDEQFSFDIDDITASHLHMELWYCTEKKLKRTTMMNLQFFEAVRQLKQVQSWKGLVRYCKQIAQSARVRENSNVDDFLGCVDISLNDITAQGIDHWFPLQGRSQKSNVQGEIHLRLTLTTRDRDSLFVDHLCHLSEYEQMLRIFVEFELEKQPTSNLSEKLSNESELILEQYAMQHELTEFQQTICRWKVFSVKYMQETTACSSLYQLLTSLKRTWSDHLTIEEEWSLVNSFSHFVDYSLKLLTELRSLFPPTDSVANSDLEQLLRCLLLVSIIQKSCHHFSYNRDIRLEILNILQLGTLKWYRNMHALSKPQIQNTYNILRGLTDFVNILNSDFNNYKTYASLFESILETDIFIIIYKQVDKLVEEDVRPTIENLSKRFHEIDVNTLSSENNILIAMFELFLALNCFTEYKKHLSANDHKCLHVLKFQEWFSEILPFWLSVARNKLMRGIRRSVELDKGTTVDTTTKVSTSAVDVTACLYQMKDFWKQLHWSNVITAYHIAFKMLDDICNGAVLYAELVDQKLHVNNYFDDDGQSIVSEPLCVTINGVEHVRHTLMAIPDVLEFNALLKAIEDTEGQANVQRCRNTVTNLLKSADEDVKNKIIFILKKVAAKMRYNFRQHMMQFAISDAVLADDAIASLLRYLDINLITLSQSLLPINFERFLSVLWMDVVDELMNQAKSGIGVKRLTYFQRLHEASSILLNFFHGEQKGLSFQQLLVEGYQQLQQILHLHRRETNELIRDYFLERLEAQRNIEISKYGTLTVKVYFYLNTLYIEILNARDIIALDQNGFSDPFVIVELAPEFIFGKKFKKQTTVQEKTLHPLFDECFK